MSTGTCQERYRVCTSAEMEVLGLEISDDCAHILGRPLGSVEQGGWNMYDSKPLLRCVVDDTPFYLPEQALVRLDAHEWIDSGMRRSWCKCCSASGFYDFHLGSYKEDRV